MVDCCDGQWRGEVEGNGEGEEETKVNKINNVDGQLKLPRLLVTSIFQSTGNKTEKCI
jgi:hypothetical protein